MRAMGRMVGVGSIQPQQTQGAMCAARWRWAWSRSEIKQTTCGLSFTECETVMKAGLTESPKTN